MLAGVLEVAELKHTGLVEAGYRKGLASPMQVGPNAVVSVGRLATDLTDPIGLSLRVSHPGTVRAQLEAG